jgi:hypothetical protein
MRSRRCTLGRREQLQLPTQEPTVSAATTTQKPATTSSKGKGRPFWMTAPQGIEKLIEMQKSLRKFLKGKYWIHRHIQVKALVAASAKLADLEPMKEDDFLDLCRTSFRHAWSESHGEDYNDAHPAKPSARPKATAEKHAKGKKL